MTVDTVFRKLVKAIWTAIDNDTRLSLAVSLGNLPKVWFSFGGKTDIIFSPFFCQGQEHL